MPASRLQNDWLLVVRFDVVCPPDASRHVIRADGAIHEKRQIDVLVSRKCQHVPFQDCGGQHCREPRDYEMDLLTLPRWRTQRLQLSRTSRLRTVKRRWTRSHTSSGRRETRRRLRSCSCSEACARESSRKGPRPDNYSVDWADVPRCGGLACQRRLRPQIPWRSHPWSGAPRARQSSRWYWRRGCIK